jgi:hypothetical protein
MNVETIKKYINQYLLIKDGSIHFLEYHFNNVTHFAQDFMDFMLTLEKLHPGTAEGIIKRIGSIRGKEIKKYEQIIQALCELVIAKKFIDCFPSEEGFKFHWEPVDSKEKNPEFMIIGKDWRILVEVKAPSLFDYNEKNKGASSQVVGRLGPMKDVMEGIDGKGNVALPLDNKVKDYLESAESKFSSFNDIDVPTYGILFICWGERMFEAITPLSNEGCGLLGENSFHKNKKTGQIIKFPSVSGVIVTQHQHFLQLILAERFQHESGGSLDYGEYWGNPTPNPIFAENIYAKNPLPRQFKEVLQTIDAGDSLDPISRNIDFIIWLK